METLAETDGEVRLNEELPIPFDGLGSHGSRPAWRGRRTISVRTDGRQHLGDPADEDYREEIVARMLCCRKNGFESFRFSQQKTSANVSQSSDAYSGGSLSDHQNTDRMEQMTNLLWSL